MTYIGQPNQNDPKHFQQAGRALFKTRRLLLIELKMPGI